MKASSTAKDWQTAFPRFILQHDSSTAGGTDVWRTWIIDDSESQERHQTRNQPIPPSVSIKPVKIVVVFGSFCHLAVEYCHNTHRSKTVMSAYLKRLPTTVATVTVYSCNLSGMWFTGKTAASDSTKGEGLVFQKSKWNGFGHKGGLRLSHVVLVIIVVKCHYGCRRKKPLFHEYGWFEQVDERSAFLWELGKNNAVTFSVVWLTQTSENITTSLFDAFGRGETGTKARQKALL